MMENNEVKLTGILHEFTYSHEAYGENFYNSTLFVKRTSGVIDEIPLLVSESFIYDGLKDVYVDVFGQIRTYNNHTHNGKKLVVNVFVQDIRVSNFDDFNSVSLEGYICKKPTFRVTPFGREISDLVLAVNRSYGKSDYIPCICWGKNARFASTFEVGDKIKLNGMFQSRPYNKNGKENIAYEVSAINVIKEIS